MKNNDLRELAINKVEELFNSRDLVAEVDLETVVELVKSITDMVDVHFDVAQEIGAIANELSVDDMIDFQNEFEADNMDYFDTFYSKVLSKQGKEKFKLLESLVGTQSLLEDLDIAIYTRLPKTN